LIDTTVRAVVSLEKLFEALESTPTAGTSLSEPVRELLRSFARVLVITDVGGFYSLGQPLNQKIVLMRRGLIAVEVLAAPN
jgi:hypothetical protein